MDPCTGMVKVKKIFLGYNYDHSTRQRFSPMKNDLDLYISSLIFKSLWHIDSVCVCV